MEIRAIEVAEDWGDATIVVGVLSDLTPVPGSQAVFEAIDSRVVEVGAFEGKSGQVLRTPRSDGTAVLVGIGDEASFETVRAAAGNAIRAVKTEDAVFLLGLIPSKGSPAL